MYKLRNQQVCICNLKGGPKSRAVFFVEYIVVRDYSSVFKTALFTCDDGIQNEVLNVM